jgi:hypothetical protein
MEVKKWRAFEPTGQLATAPPQAKGSKVGLGGDRRPTHGRDRSEDDTQRDFVSVGEFARIFAVSTRMVRNWIKLGKLPAERIGRVIRRPCRCMGVGKGKRCHLHGRNLPGPKHLLERPALLRPNGLAGRLCATECEILRVVKYPLPDLTVNPKPWLRLANFKPRLRRVSLLSYETNSR